MIDPYKEGSAGGQSVYKQIHRFKGCGLSVFGFQNQRFLKQASNTSLL